MITLRHSGIYVEDILRMEHFYSETFSMKAVCSQNAESSPLLDELYGRENCQILTTKLITPYGQVSGSGDMIELVKVLSFACDALPEGRPICHTGMNHIAMGVDDIVATCDKIVEFGGKVSTQIYTMQNGNKCAFARDPEGNWLELIQRCS